MSATEKFYDKSIKMLIESINDDNEFTSDGRALGPYVIFGDEEPDKLGNYMHIVNGSLRVHNPANSELSKLVSDVENYNYVGFKRNYWNVYTKDGKLIGIAPRRAWAKALNAEPNRSFQIPEKYKSHFAANISDPRHLPFLKKLNIHPDSERLSWYRDK